MDEKMEDKQNSEMKEKKKKEAKYNDEYFNQFKLLKYESIDPKPLYFPYKYRGIENEIEDEKQSWEEKDDVAKWENYKNARKKAFKEIKELNMKIGSDVLLCSGNGEQGKLI